MFKKQWLVVLFLMIVVLLGACSSSGFFAQAGNKESALNKIENKINYPIEDFNVIDHNGDPFSSEDLKGKVWLANFIFTNCRTVCPPMTAHMAEIQRRLEAEGLDDVQLVSFSVDPEVDTPEMLTEFASRFTDNLDNWHFLTGYVQKYIEQFARMNFHTLVEKPESDDQVIHGTSIYLVTQEGVAIKEYSGVSNVPYDEIIHDVKILVESAK